MNLTCFRISNGALAGENLPNRIKILNWGDNPNKIGDPIRVTDRTAAELPGNQRAFGFDSCALDYEHNTVPGSVEYKRTTEPRKVAGYFHPEVVPNDGIYLVMDSYTPSGMDNAREFIDLSPTLKLDKKTNEVLFVHSTALCRQGSVDGLHYYNITIPEEMPVEAMQKLIDELTKQVADLTAKVNELMKPKSDADSVVALNVKVSDLEKTLTTLSIDWASNEAKREKQILLDLAKRDGKVVALNADAIAKLSVSDLTAHIASIQSTVPLNRQTPPDAGSSGDGHGTHFARYNAITDPAEKAAYYRANREHIVG